MLPRSVHYSLLSNKVDTFHYKPVSLTVHSRFPHSTSDNPLLRPICPWLPRRFLR